MPSPSAEPPSSRVSSTTSRPVAPTRAADGRADAGAQAHARRRRARPRRPRRRGPRSLSRHDARTGRPRRRRWATPQGARGAARPDEPLDPGAFAAVGRDILLGTGEGRSS
jgi:hypothetical protein